MPVPNNIQYLHIGCYWVLADIIGEDWEGINGIGGSLEGIAGCLGGIGERRQLHEVTLQQPSSLRGTDGYYWRVMEGIGEYWRVLAGVGGYGRGKGGRYHPNRTLQHPPVPFSTLHYLPWGGGRYPP